MARFTLFSFAIALLLTLEKSQHACNDDCLRAFDGCLSQKKVPSRDCQMTFRTCLRKCDV